MWHTKEILRTGPTGDQPINQSRSEKATVDPEPNDRGCNATWPTSSRVREERSWLEGFWLPSARLRLRCPRLRPTRPRPTSCEGHMSVTRRPARARPAPKHRPAPEHCFLHRELEAAIPVGNTWPCYKLLTQRERETDRQSATEPGPLDEDLVVCQLTQKAPRATVSVNSAIVKSLRILKACASFHKRQMSSPQCKIPQHACPLSVVLRRNLSCKPRT